MNLYVKITDDTGKVVDSHMIDLELYRNDEMYRMRVWWDFNKMLKFALPTVKKSKKKEKP